MENLKDELNPKFIFSNVNTNLLVDAISGKLNLQNLAMNELVARGLDKEGLWVGFEKAKREFENDLRDLHPKPRLVSNKK